MRVDRVIDLEILTEDLVEFYIENIKDEDVKRDLKKSFDRKYCSIIVDLRGDYFSVHSINDVDFKDKFYTETEEEYLELELINEDGEIYTYNDVAGFIIKDDFIYTLWQISDNNLIDFILVAHTCVSDAHIEELRQFCMLKKFKNVTVFDYKGGAC